jgi:lipoprotein NlpD
MQNQTLQVQSGDKVKKGQVIATTGKNNFYFEMKKFETPINPNWKNINVINHLG